MTEAQVEGLRTGLKKMVIRECNVKDLTPAQIGDDDPIVGGSGSLKLDSLDAVEIVSALERSFGVRLEDAGSARHVVKSFRAMSDYVVKNTPPERLNEFLIL